MKQYRQQVTETLRFINEQTDVRPRVGILTGTGLGNSARGVKISDTFDYKDIPHFPVSTVESHTGKLLFGTIGPRPVVMMQGRFHLYEGYSPLEVTYPIRVMQALGVKTLILTNAAGGFNPAFAPGDLMLITDHINLTGENPLVGPHVDEWGIRFPDMNGIYNASLMALAEKGAKEQGARLQKGVYAGLKGPSLETPAEVRYLKTIGADAVGFSTVQEVIAGVHGGMEILGISTITNVNDPDNPVPATIEEILEVADVAASKLETLIQYIMENMENE